MGDALTVALMEKREFKPEHFARFHPGGSLGRRLLSKVRDEMISSDLPLVKPNDSLIDILHCITSCKLGLALVIENEEIKSIITDGDLRRVVEKHQQRAFDLVADDFANPNPISIDIDSAVEHAFQLMDAKGVTSLVVYDNGQFAGIMRK